MVTPKHQKISQTNGPFSEDRIWPPPPTLDFLSKDFCPQPGLGWKFLLSGRGKNCSPCSFQDSHSLTEGNQVSLVRIQFSHNQNQMKNQQTLGVGIESWSWFSHTSEDMELVEFYWTWSDFVKFSSETCGSSRNDRGHLPMATLLRQLLLHKLPNNCEEWSLQDVHQDSCLQATEGQAKQTILGAWLRRCSLSTPLHNTFQQKVDHWKRNFQGYQLLVTDRARVSPGL